MIAIIILIAVSTLIYFSRASNLREEAKDTDNEEERDAINAAAKKQELLGIVKIAAYILIALVIFFLIMYAS